MEKLQCLFVPVFALLHALGCAEPPALTIENEQLDKGQYRVEEGDSLGWIAKHHYGEGGLWYVLLNANPEIRFRPNFTLSPGEVINVPSKEDIDRSLPKSEFPKDLPAKYVVLPGDSLHFIAQNCYGDREKWKVLYEANKENLSEAVLEDSRRLIAGQVLHIPAP